jgi:hypothetical protein
MKIELHTKSGLGGNLAFFENRLHFPILQGAVYRRILKTARGRVNFGLQQMNRREINPFQK